MSEKWIVVSNGVNKDTNKPYSILRAIREGKNKETQQPYAFLDEKTFHREEEILTIGTILHYERQRVSVTELERSSRFTKN